MNKDLIYIFDKLTFKRQELGEIQSNFNMSLTIDGTKDSTKVIVWSFNESEIEPNTICWHAKTNTWWIVAHDKIERYLNENETFIYVHNLQLEGAIELLNARDLTDCGFNQNTYTKGQFLNRLIKLSSFEFQGGVFRITADTNFLNQKVDYVKTFENYSLLSAIREFLDSYNKCAKLEFTQRPIGGIYTLHFANLVIINKTGDNTLTSHNMSEFNDVRETKTMDKNSFGTTVVSNAENVISSIAKTYPSTGAVMASGDAYRITPSNAFIRLPSKVYKANWVKIISTKTKIDFTITIDDISPSNVEGWVNLSSNASIEYFFSLIYYNIRNYFSPSLPAADILINEIENNRQSILDKMDELCTLTLYNGNNLDPVDGTIIQGENLPPLNDVTYYSKDPTGNIHGPYILCDKETKQMLPRTYQGLAWERGSNLITGFEAFVATGGQTAQQIRIRNHGNLTIFDYSYNDIVNNHTYRIVLKTNSDVFLHFGPETEAHRNGDVQFIVNYIPMSDIKVKVDNSRTKRDMHLYNQNGKLTDSFALAKMLNSYSKEISSDTITKYKWYYSFDSVPKVGSMVNTTSGETYVINNVSLDFSQNEKSNTDFGYIIECEITMSKYVSTKSLMVNPNTNIRDYGIPQNFNVKRKQLYRDYYELGYSLNSDADSNYYIDPQRMFTFGRETQSEINLITVIKCIYDDEINGNNEWFYQLETITYYMNKMVYIMLDFNDNNIVGYSNQNAWSGFVVDRIFSGLIDTINTPISYVDKNGKVRDFDLLYLTNEQLTECYDEYIEEHRNEQHYADFVNSNTSLYNYSVFIPGDIYNKALNYGGSPRFALRITENNYNKDAIEVPVFEYACQVDDSNDVLIGDNILTQHENCIYFYHYIVGENLTQDNVFDDETLDTEGTNIKMLDSATIKYFDLDTDLKVLEIKLHNDTTYNRNTGAWNDYIDNDIPTNTDIAIFRHAYNMVTGEELVELMFIAKNIPQSAIDQNDKTLILTLNHYKLN